MNKILSALVLSLGLSGAANAEFVSTDWKVDGDNLATLDSNSGLEWLDLGYTRGLSESYDQVVSMLDDELLGWRLPTKQELSTLLDNAFSVSLDTDYVWVAVSEENIDFTSYFGTTYGNNIAYSLGRFKEANGLIGLNGAYGSTKILNGYGNYVSHGYSGVYLVSDGGLTLSSINNPGINVVGGDQEGAASVPLPATGLLMLLGLGGLALRRKAV